MSYTIGLIHVPCHACGRTEESPDCPDPTYNLTAIYDLALTNEPALPNAEASEFEVVVLGASTDRPRGLRLLNGRLAKDTLVDIEAAIQRMENVERTAEFVKLEGPDGWGTLPQALRIMKKLFDLAKANLNATWYVG
jgi:hypothetical protein